MATVLYCGTGSGVATLAREGEGAWQVKRQALQPFTVRQLAVSPLSPNLVAAGTRGDGVWLSKDGGETWSKPSYGRPGPGKVTSIVFDPRDPNTLWAGGEPIELFVSRDLGQHWEKLEGVRAAQGVAEITYPVSDVEPHVRDIVVHPTDPNTMYLALQVGSILKTMDGGKTWGIVGSGYDPDVHVIAMDPANPERLYISTGGEGMRSGRAPGRSLYRSEDGGETWAPLAMEFSNEYSAALAMRPGDPATLLTSLANGNPGEWRRPSGPEAVLVRSRDGGRSWQALAADQPNATQRFAGAIAYDGERPDHVYAGLRRGELTASYDGGESWEDLGIQLAQVNDIKVVHN